MTAGNRRHASDQRASSIRQEIREANTVVLRDKDLDALSDFRCSSGEPWEDLVEQQIRGPLPRRYLATPPRFDGRMLIATREDGEILAVGAHHIEPTRRPAIPKPNAVVLRRR